LILAIAGLPGAAPGAAIVAAQYHCAGSAQLNGNTNLPTLQKALALPSAAAVRQLALERISGLLADGLNLETNASAASLIAPLLGDVLETESLGSFGATASNSLNFVLVLRLDSKRAQLWHDNLDKALGGAGAKFTAKEFKGWRWNRAAADSIWIIPARDWLLVGRGNDLLPVQTEYLRQVGRKGRPAPALTNNWLEADLDCPRLAGWLPDWLRLLKPARIKIGVAPETNILRVTARMIYPEAIPWNSVAWQAPDELVEGQIISFTAGQNVAAFLNLSPAFSRLDGDPLTNQFYVWALDQLPFLNYAAWPVVDSANTLEKLSTEASDAFSSDLQQFNGTELLWQADQRRLVLSNLRVMLPSLQAVQGQYRDYLLLSFFPLPSANQPAPDELWKQIIGRTNLVYYDWEKTSARLQEWRMLGRMILSRSRAPNRDLTHARMLADKWFYELTPLPGSTITEITRVAPNELSVVRNAPFGFTAVEMFLLSDWLSAVGSPPIDSRLPAH
jgi:hypothetical protein